MVEKVMYMDRKTRIMEIISGSDKPVSASKIAKELGVSRQIIVGDVALLRASGEDITATPRGYILDTNRSNHYTIAVKHNNDQLEDSVAQEAKKMFQKYGFLDQDKSFLTL